MKEPIFITGLRNLRGDAVEEAVRYIDLLKMDAERYRHWRDKVSPNDIPEMIFVDTAKTDAAVDQDIEWWEEQNKREAERNKRIVDDR
jgi:hypothetical protein